MPSRPDPTLAHTLLNLFNIRFQNQVVHHLPDRIHDYLNRISPVHRVIDPNSAETFWNTWDLFVALNHQRPGWFGFVHMLWWLLGIECHISPPRYSPYLINAIREKLLSTLNFQPLWLPSLQEKFNEVGEFLRIHLAPTIRKNQYSFEMNVSGVLPRLLFDYNVAYEQVQINHHLYGEGSASSYQQLAQHLAQRIAQTPIKIQIYLDAVISQDPKKFVHLYSEVANVVHTKLSHLGRITDKNSFNTGNEKIIIYTPPYHFSMISRYAQKASAGNMFINLRLDPIYYRSAHFLLPYEGNIPRDLIIDSIFKRQTISSAFIFTYMQLAPQQEEHFSNDLLKKLASEIYAVKRTLDDGWFISPLDHTALQWFFNKHKSRTYEQNKAGPLDTIVTDLIIKQYYLMASHSEQHAIRQWMQKLRQKFTVSVDSENQINQTIPQPTVQIEKPQQVQESSKQSVLSQPEVALQQEKALALSSPSTEKSNNLPAENINPLAQQSIAQNASLSAEKITPAFQNLSVATNSALPNKIHLNAINLQELEEKLFSVALP